MEDVESKRIREEVIRALADEGADVSAFEDAPRALEEVGAASVPLPTWEGVPEAAASLDDGAPQEGGPARELTAEERAQAEAQAEREGLAALFDVVRFRSHDGELSEPSQWGEEGLVPAHLSAEEWEMLVYEYVDDHAAEERAVEEAAAAARPAARSATVAVGIPRFAREQVEEEEPAAEAEAPEASDASEAEAPESVDAEKAGAAEEVSVAEEPDAPVAPRCADIVALVGAHSYYLYSREHMTDRFAHWAFLAREDDRVATFVECVREESRTYPRPMQAWAFTNDPFGYSSEEVDELWHAVHESGAYPDIDTVTASNGDVYYFSTDYLTPAYAGSLAEWNSVERSMFL